VFAQKLQGRDGVRLSGVDPIGRDLMSAASTTGSFEECADDLGDLIVTLRSYPPTVLVFALRAHLCGLLQALRVHHVMSGEQIAAFVEEMAREALADPELADPELADPEPVDPGLA
jgi:hypothetical protein